MRGFGCAHPPPCTPTRDVPGRASITFARATEKPTTLNPGSTCRIAGRRQNWLMLRLTPFLCLSCSFGQTRVQALVRTEPGGTCSAERRIRHSFVSFIRDSGPSDPAENPSGPAVLRAPARRGPAGPPRIRLDAWGLRQRIHLAGNCSFSFFFLRAR